MRLLGPLAAGLLAACTRTALIGSEPAPSSTLAQAPSASAARVLSPSASPAAPPAASAAAAQANDPSFHKDLLAIARDYRRLNPLDGTYWAPTDCAPPRQETFLSRAASAEHGQKLYTLWVKDRATYPSQRRPPSILVDPPSPSSMAAFAQVLVKESWTAVETCAHGTEFRLSSANRDGKTFVPCDKAPIFILYRPPAGTPGTDEGWVYGTTSPDGKEVTSSGRVSSCMGCHLLAPRGRLFGLPAD